MTNAAHDALSRAVNRAVETGAPIFTEQNQRDAILDALQAFAAQRPGLDPRDYISDYRDTAGRAAYRSDSRKITRDLQDSRVLMGAVRRAFTLDVDALRAAFGAFSGRLTLKTESNGRIELTYCTGQYWPTEYRKAVCAVLASALWRHWAGDFGPGEANKIRLRAKREFGRGFASRWFN